MRTRSGTLLIDALLDRLGDTQANALVAQLNSWLSRSNRDIRKGRAKPERRRAITRTHNPQGITVSKTQKDQPS